MAAPFGFGTYAELVTWILKWIVGRQEIAQSKELKQGKAAQVEQDQNDRIERLVKTAMSDPDSNKRLAAAEELRRMDSE